MSTGKKKRCKRSESISTRIGLNFPVSHIRRSLRNGNYSDRIGATAPVYLAAVIEYLTAELLQLAGYEAHERYLRSRTDLWYSFTQKDDSVPLLNKGLYSIFSRTKQEEVENRIEFEYYG
ncbi:histone H2A type 1-A [Wuchereria bancrofti]|uniref:Histone H2A n=1 Tax=Wuchereria bancrofti TaxID=6293 RepID=J9DNT2_WUCBA|nr:histone H2A type 1-A [Wuchereria bancrofti]